MPSWKRSLSRVGVLGNGSEAQEKTQEMRSIEHCHHHKRLEAALETKPLRDLVLVVDVAGQDTSLEIHESRRETTSRGRVRTLTKILGVRPSFLYFLRRVWLLVYIRQISGNRSSPSTFTKRLPFTELPNERREPPKTFCGAQPFRFGNSG